MKYFLTVISFTLIMLSGSCRKEFAYSLDGFTNRKEAKNIMVDGVKQGKWVEYGFLFWILRFDTLSYTLTIYKDGVQYGTARKYYMNGQLEGENTCIDGQLEGVAKGYYKNGVLKAETHFKHDKYDGSVKAYFSNGVLDSEATYINGLPNGVVRHYHANGKLKSQTNWNNGKEVSTKDYPENDYQ